MVLSKKGGVMARASGSASVSVYYITNIIASWLILFVKLPSKFALHQGNDPIYLQFDQLVGVLSDQMVS